MHVKFLMKTSVYYIDRVEDIDSDTEPSHIQFINGWEKISLSFFSFSCDTRKWLQCSRKKWNNNALTRNNWWYQQTPVIFLSVLILLWYINLNYVLILIFSKLVPFLSNIKKVCYKYVTIFKYAHKSKL